MAVEKFQFEVGSLPLSGVRIVDLSWAYAGPSATRTLAELGASVIKIESPRRPDGARALIQDRNESHPDYWNRGLYFAEKNLGKRAMTLDLTKSLGIDAFLRLIRMADVVIESFTPRVMENFGLGFERLVGEQPHLIMASLSGYGETGPRRNRPAYGSALEPEAGITFGTGYLGGPPVKTGLAYTDPISGVLAAGAILHALYEKFTGLRDGSLFIDLAEREAVLPFVGEALAEYQIEGKLPNRIGNRHRMFAPQGCYECLDDGWVAITVRDDDEWRILAQAIGIDGLGLMEMEERRERVDEIDSHIAEYCVTRDRFEVMESLQELGIPVGVVQDGRDLLSDPQLNARSFFYSVDHPVTGERRYHRFIGSSFEKWSMQSTKHAPLLDEHTDQILAELGYSVSEIEEFRFTGVSGNEIASLGRSGPTLDLEWLLEQGGVSAVDEPLGSRIPSVRQSGSSP